MTSRRPRARNCGARHERGLAAVATLSAASLLAGAEAHAQAASATAGADVLQEVIVTAERREQSLQDLPVSVTVFTAEDLARQGVDNVQDIQQVAPSVAINSYNRSTFINIRGVGIAQSAPTSNPGVAYYIDGQLIPHEQFIGQSFYDLASVEVLRGPQGTLTGQNSTGGAVYVRTPEPRFGEYSGTIDQTFGDDDWLRTIVAANFGFSESVALRISAVHDDRDSYVDNIGPSPSEPGRGSLDAVRANLAYRSAEERVRLYLRGEYFDYDTDNLAVKNRTSTDTRPYVISEDAVSFLRQTGWRASAEAVVRASEGVDVRYLMSLQDGNTRDQTDGDRSSTARPRPPANATGRVSYARTDFQTFINELNLLSRGDGPLQWVVGAFSLEESVPVTLLRDNNNTVNFVSSTSTIITRAENSSWSIFGQLNWFFTDQFELVAGGRYSWDEQVYERIALPGPPFPPGTDRFGPPAESEEPTGKLGLNFHASEDTMWYATASKGYKAGGVNLTLNTPDFKPETNLVYELGLKTETLDRRLRVNGDVFYSDYQDIQLSSLFNGLPLTQNAASGEAWGAELELLGRFGNLGFNLGIGYLDATFAGPATIVNTITNLPQRVNEGDTLPFSPEFTANAGIEYEIPIGSTTLTPRLQWAHLDEQLATPFPSAASIVPSRDVVDLRVTWRPNEAWRVEAFVTNLLDEEYVASQIQNSSSADGGMIYGAPQQWGLRFAFDFGT